MTPRFRTRDLLWLVLLAGAYFLSGKLGLRLAFVQANATPVWPPTGLAIAAMMLLGLRFWPAIFVGAFFVNFTTPPGTVWTSLGIAAGNTLEAVLAGWLVRRFARGDRAFERAGDVFRFTGLAAIAATTVSATIGVLVLSLGGFSPWPRFAPVWFTWWLGDASGALVVTPLLVTCLRPPAPDLRQAREGAFLLGLVVIASLLVFRGMLEQLPVGYATLPLLLLLAFRMGPRGAALGALALSSIALWGTLTGRGPFVRADANQSLLLLQAFNATAALTAFVLAAVVTERSAALQASRAGEDQIRLITDTLPVLVAYIDRDHRYRFANRAYEDWFGIPAEDLRGRLVREVVGEAAHEALLPHVRAALEGERVRFEMQVPLRGGSRWVQGDYVPDRSVPGRIAGFVALVRDIEDRIRAEQASEFLARATTVLGSSLNYDETLTSLAELAVPRVADWCMVQVKDEEGRIHRVALAHSDPARIRELAGLLDRHPLPEREIWQTGRPELIPEVTEERLSRNVPQEELREYVRQLRIRSAIVVPLRIQGRTMGVLTFASASRTYGADDLSLAVELGTRAGIAVENALLYRDAQRAIAARDEFLSVASHELKTPLTSLLLNLDGLLRLARKKGVELHPDAGAMVDGARKQVLELGALINTMLDFTKIRAGKLQIERAELDLADVAREVARQLEGEFRGIRSELILDLRPVPGWWDRMRMMQVVTNLLTNAIKYGRGGPVRMSVGPGGSGARMVVQDQGIGMTADQVDRIFHPFERAVTSRHYEGLGLGLYIVRQIVEAHGGWVRVESAAGVGSTFTVDLPLQ